MAKISFGDPFTRVRKVESVSKTTVLNERVQHVYSRNPTNGKDYVVGEIVKERNGHRSFLGIRLFNIKTQKWVGGAASWTKARQYAQDSADKLFCVN